MLPSTFWVPGAKDYKHSISDQLLSEVSLLLDEDEVMVCSLYKTLADIILAQHNITPTTNFEEAFIIYLFLVQTFSDLMNE